MTLFEKLGIFATVSDLKFVNMLIDMNTQAKLLFDREVRNVKESI